MDNRQSSPKKFELTLRMSVQELDSSGYRANGGGLSVDDTLKIGYAGFMEIAGILGKFHELAEAIRAERAGSD